MASSSLEPPAGVTRPIVFFDISIGETPAGRIKMATLHQSLIGIRSTGSAPAVYAAAQLLRYRAVGLYSSILITEPPRTLDNYVRVNTDKMPFRKATKGRRSIECKCLPKPDRGGRGNTSIPQFMIQGGDFLNHDGTGSFSIYGSQFEDENFTVKHTGPGLLSMANSGPGTNGCQFFITTAPAEFLDGKHVIFGRVVEGLLTVRKIENVPTGANNRPKLTVKISECGEM